MNELTESKEETKVKTEKIIRKLQKEATP